MTERRLEIGGGPSPAHPDWEQLDLLDWSHRGNPTTLQADIRSIPVPDCTFREVFACNVLEHVSFLDTRAALAEWRRVLVPSGLLTVTVPDLLGVFRDYTEGRNTFPELVERVYGSQTYDLDLHRAGFCLDSLQAAVTAADLAVVERRSTHAGGGATVKARRPYDNAT